MNIRRITVLLTIMLMIVASSWCQRTTRFPGGVNNSSPNGTFKDLPIPSNEPVVVVFDEFVYESPLWKETRNILDTNIDGLGIGTTVIKSSSGSGMMQLYPGSAIGDEIILSSTEKTFVFEAGKKAWFSSKIKIDNPTTSVTATPSANWIVGLVEVATTTVATNIDYNGVFFYSHTNTSVKGTPSHAIHFTLNKMTGAGATTVSQASTDIVGITDYTRNTWVSLGMYYDGGSELQLFVDDTQKNTVSITSTVLMPTTPLALVAGIRNVSEADTNLMDIDYIMFARER